jgi:hypothetical protein
MLPLASPLCLPAGILGHPSIGIEGVRAVLTDGVSTPNELSTAFLELPIVRAWLMAAMEFPDVMTIEVMGRGAVSQSLRSSTVSTATQPSLGATNANTELAKLANIGVHDYWRAMESTLAFRFFIDNISGAAKPHRSAGPFYRYLTTAGNGLYRLDNILGQRPVEMGYEVLVLRPPLAAKRRKEMFHLDRWTTNSSTCPTFLREYKSQSIDPATTATFPLRRNDGSLDPSFLRNPSFQKQQHTSTRSRATTHGLSIRTPTPITNSQNVVSSTASNRSSKETTPMTYFRTTKTNYKHYNKNSKHTGAGRA